MKKSLRFPVLACIVLSAAQLPALPKVAVLDLSLQKGIDAAVIVPVTESIMEEVVGARAYVVLDRAYIEQVLKEKEFQLSGLVSDSQVAQAGQYLGADYVVAGKIQMVGETYFVVAKMIEVKTGVIVAQSSEQGEGKAAVLITMAHTVGKKLVGGSPISALAPAQPGAAAQAASPSPQPSPAGKERQAPGPGGGGAGPVDFSAIEEDDPLPRGQVSLSVMTQYAPDSEAARAFKEILGAFGAKYPNIKIEERNYRDAGPYFDELWRRFGAKNPPDIFKLNKNPDFGPVSPAADLSPLLRGRESAYLPAARRAMGPRGKVYFLPETLNLPHVLYANRRILDRLGLAMPKSLDDLIAQQGAIRKAGLVPIAMADKDGWQMQSCLLSVLASRTGGMGWLDRAIRKDGTDFKDPSFVQAIAAVKRMADAKMFPPNLLELDYNAPLEMFNSEKAVYLIDGAWRFNALRPDLTVEFAALPDLPGQKGPSGSTVANVDGYGMSSSLAGEKAQAAWLWLWFSSGPEGAKARFKAGGAASAVIDPRLFLDRPDDRLSRFFDYLKDAEIDDFVDLRMNGQIVNDQLKLVLAGKKKPESAADEIEKWAAANLPSRRR
jgi:raffinose/stachyose/melibiose transport system substrate-binding protein